MNPENQRIAIAEACGLDVSVKDTCPACNGCTPYEAGDDYGITLWRECRHCSNTGKVKGYILRSPDYLNSLDAMHKAEKILTDDQWDTYCDLLGGSLQSCASAAADQRAEAFLRTIGKWEDDQ